MEGMVCNEISMELRALRVMKYGDVQGWLAWEIVEEEDLVQQAPSPSSLLMM